jgi:hypothetical protein
MEPVAPFAEEYLVSIAKILADTSKGLTGSKIEQLDRAREP